MRFPDRQDVVEVFRRHGAAPRQLRELATLLRVKGRAKRDFVVLLEEMVGKGQLVKLRGERYALPRVTDQLQGRISLHRDGFGFVIPDAGGDDVYIPEKHLAGAMDGDSVKIAVSRGRQGRRREGRVLEVLERAVTELVGVFRRGGKHGFFLPQQRKERSAFEVLPGPAGRVDDGTLVIARIENYPKSGLPGRVEIVEILGDRHDPKVEVLATAYRFGLPHAFSPAALVEAAEVPAEVAEAEITGRRDLRQSPFVTIDGETAKDFDDAVCLEPLADGFRLWVAIADVAHYLRQGSALDLEALQRGTSVYFPGTCLPMLPESLSNGICSLNPAVDRLVMVAELDFDDEGAARSSSFYPAVINSKGRLTYNQVQGYLDTGERCQAQVEAVFPMLTQMASLAQRLLQRRQQRGSLDFEIPEAVIELDEAGKPVGVAKFERKFAHRLIEEFMLAANEAVASYLEQAGRDLLYRVHEPPLRQKLEEFQQFVAHFNYGLRLDDDKRIRRELQQLLHEVDGKPEERAINQLLLRSMKQASYQVENLGHFGLASECYCHFTSPIRRYPDLIVHRVLRQQLLGRQSYSHSQLGSLGDALSACERRAMAAERDLVALNKCQFMAERINECFAGVVSGVQPFGIFVELEEFFIEGLVHISALDDDYYHFDEALLRLVGYNRRKIYAVGDRVEVRLVRVDYDQREIDFVIATAEKESGPKRSKKKR